MSEAEGSSIPGSAFGMAGWAASPGRKLSKTSPHCYRAAVDRDARVLQVATTRFVEDPACDHAGRQVLPKLIAAAASPPQSRTSTRSHGFAGVSGGLIVGVCLEWAGPGAAGGGRA